MSLAPGTRIGAYDVVEMLGTGGMGEVYRAHDTRLGRDVAVKIRAHGDMNDPSARARLIREAQHASILNHPHICTIHEVGETAKHAFIVHEHVEGHTLSAMIEANGLLLPGPTPEASDHCALSAARNTTCRATAGCALRSGLRAAASARAE
jgi:eukaryotic-like serine/threonine-protein kinase